MLGTLTPPLAGLLVHLCFHQHQPKTIPQIFGLLWGPPVALALWLNGPSFLSFLVYQGVYYATLVTSIILYRISPFHPLAEYPGPVICKITRLWTAYISRSGNQHRYYHELHERYGPVVRTADLQDPTIFTFVKLKRFLQSSAQEGTDGTRARDMRLPELQIHQAYLEQSTRRSTRSGEMVSRRVMQLVSAVEVRTSEEIDLAKWLQFFSFDVMGDLAFGGRFNYMKSGVDEQGLIYLLNRAIGLADVLGTIPWVRPFVKLLPASSAMMQFVSMSKEIALERKAKSSIVKDLFYYLLNEEENENAQPLDLNTITNEAALVIIAGSDTTSSALAHAFFNLVTNMDVYDRLRKEVDTAFPAQLDAFDTNVLASLPMLQAVINETMRLAPATPNGTQRVPPPHVNGPFEVAGRIIPEKTTVQVTTYSIHRDPRYFWPNPDRFDPDRWLVDAKQKSPAEFRHDTRAYLPFSYGPTNCVGKSLALLEMRMAIVALIRKFDFELAPGWDVSRWEQNCKDHFVFTTGPLPVIATARA